MDRAKEGLISVNVFAIVFHLMIFTFVIFLYIIYDLRNFKASITRKKKCITNFRRKDDLLPKSCRGPKCCSDGRNATHLNIFGVNWLGL